MNANQIISKNQSKDKKESLTSKYEKPEEIIDSQDLMKDLIDEKDTPFVREMLSFNSEDKKIGHQNIEESPKKIVSTIMNKEEKTELKNDDAKQKIVSSPSFDYDGNFGDLPQQEIPFILDEYFDEPKKKIEIQNTLLGKKILKNDSESQKKNSITEKENNVNKNLKKDDYSINEEDSFNDYFEDSFDDDSKYNNFYGLEEDENIEKDKVNNIEEIINLRDNKDFTSEKNNIQEDEIFDSNKLNPSDILCNKTVYNQELISDSSTENMLAYIGPPVYNSSTYYKTKI